ncbi:MAG: 50S ribosomal protein L23 [Candidatus Latescibacterota bacterium]|nr:MAG: 50S ribosomal protein L23 [Candidatus Latescibacterota bacterium]
MSDIRLLVQKPLITEKSTALKEANNRYLFKVDIRANKRQIKQAVEEVFNVRVKKVTTAVYRGKPRVVMNRAGRFTGKAPNWKKAYVTLAEGDSIDVFDVV